MSDKLSFEFNAKNQDRLLAGQASGSMIEMPSIASTGNKLNDDHPDNQKAKDRRLHRFLDIIETTRAYIEQLRNDINDMERMFSERDDAWREELALKILDPDEIPQQREGESIEDYRKRLEPFMINKMLNADGSIKKQYMNDPELSDYAQWAQKKYHLRVAQGYVRELEDPNILPERVEEIYEDIKRRKNTEEATYAARGAETLEVRNEVKEIDDANRDEFSATEQKIDSSFFTPKT